MLPSWVDIVWDECAEREVHADEAKFLKYKCPIFKNFTICASGLSGSQKEEIKRLVESNGGTYNGTFNAELTTHLVTDEAKGEKYKSAKHHNIFIVTTKWIFDSCATSYCLPVKDYPLSESTNAQTSTPSDNNRRIARRIPLKDEIDISVIADRSATNIRNVVNDTENSTMISQANISLVTQLNDQNQTNVSSRDILKELNSIGKIKSTLFDGFGIFCENFDSGINERLKKLCNSGGAVRFDEFNSDVTHVIVNQVNEKRCKTYVDSNPEINILSIDWFINSCGANEIVDYKEYFVFKNVLNSVKTPKKRARETTTDKVNISSRSNNSTFKLYENEINQCLAQYMPKTSNNTSTTIPVLQESNSNIVQQTKNSSNTSILNSSLASKSGKSGAFAGKKFKIYGFEAEETLEWKQLIETNGGSLNGENLNDDDYDDVDLIVAPLTITEQVNKSLGQQLVTPYWIKKCIETNKLVRFDDNVLYQPIPRFNNDLPLKDCVITISGYLNYEKDAINSLCVLLGAVTQASFSLSTKNAILPNTHLICKTAEGPKFNASIKWNIPAVRVEWLLESVATGFKADESKYMIQDENFKTSEFIESLNRIRNSHLLNTQLTNDEYVEQQHEDDVPTMRLDASETQLNAQNGNDSSLSMSVTESKKPRLEVEEAKEQSFKISTGEPLLFKTPQPINPRLKELRKSSGVTPQTPHNQSVTSNESSNWPTPAFLDSKKFNGEYRIKNLDWDLVNKLLETPEGAPKQHPETPYQDLFEKGVKACGEASKTSAFYAETESPDIYWKKMQKAQQFYNADEEEENDRIQPTPAEQREMKNILKNVKIYVAKKLAKQQAELNQLVENLGGEFVWIYNHTVTHVIFSGKVNDPNKELKLAREQNKYIVSPHWLYACNEQKMKLDETQFPYTYNPSKGAVVASRTPRVSRIVQHSPAPPQPQPQKPSSQQISRSQLAKIDPKRLIEKFDSDSDDDTTEISHGEELFSSEINSKLLKRKPQQNQTNITEQDSDMNFVDSQLLKNFDKVASTNEKNGVQQIPDSIDIRCNFLDQLQDKLTFIKNNTTNASTTSLNQTPENGKIRSRYRSGNYDKNEVDTFVSNEDKDADLLQVKHGSSGSEQQTDESTSVRKTYSRHKSFENKHRRESAQEIEQQQLLQHQLNSDDSNTNQNHAVQPSQIQITRWKEDDNHMNTKRKNDAIMHRFSNLNKN